MTYSAKNSSLFSPGPPHLDTAQAIGLAKYDNLIAVLALKPHGLNVNGLIIPQLQDATGVKKPVDTGRSGRTEYQRTGLHDGIDWRCTLVRESEEVARRIGFETLTIQSHANNKYIEVQRHGAPGYDGIARALGYIQTESLDWMKRL